MRETKDKNSKIKKNKSEEKEIAKDKVELTNEEVKRIVKRLAGDVELDFVSVKQDVHLAKNQENKVRCGDNGIFKGVPLTKEQKELAILIRQDLEKRKALKEAKKLEQEYEHQLSMQKGENLKSTQEQGVDFDEQ